ncbi:ankyrin repeat protein [Colletotrichum scovillei]|uniref:ankyrin repeat protein n=1 Tax=Colletotrichum scovillei TaxID=1209932 RepID=UPI0015C3E6B8|nr:ankyrin repeat protein [Colletotrichum scovillei]KAF4784224.1 ankyrin repeat protein [Colletotrichum scovillei]
MTWSAVRVLLKTNVSERQDLVAIMGCTDMILCLLRRGRVYEEIYIGELPRPATQQDLKEKLVEVYTTCLEFLSFVNEELKNKNLSRFLDALLDPGQGEQRVSAIKALEKDLELAAHVCEAQVSEKHRKLLQSLEGPLKRVDDNVAAVLEKLKKRDREEAMGRISTVPVGVHHLEKREKRTEGTCEWLISNAKFRDWENLACSSVFWLQGNIGTGKSFLSSKVIDRYWVHDGIASQSPSLHDEGFAFFYCNGSDSTRKSYDSIVRSYVRQLSEIPNYSDSVHRAAYCLAQAKSRIQDAISIRQCESALIEIINSYPRTALILDALDECDSMTKKQLVRLFTDLIQKSNRLLKIFVASRPEFETEGCLKLQTPQTLIQISTTDNIGDIERFVTAEAKNWKNASVETKELVKVTLVERSNGMFRWTYLQMEQLKKFKTQNDIRKRLGQLPNTLSEAYDEIYDKSKEADSERFILQRTVRWAMCVNGPLESSFLLPAIKLESETIGKEVCLEDSDLTEEKVEVICRHLVVKDTLGIWKFSHASVSEYFGTKQEPWVEHAKAEVASFLINRLIDCCSAFGTVWPVLEHMWLREWQEMSLYNLETWFQARPRGHVHTSDPHHPLQLYSQLNWLDCVHGISSQDAKASVVTQSLKRFLGEKGPQQSSEEYQIFCRYVVPMLGSLGGVCRERRNMAYVHVSPDIMPPTNPILGIVTFGLHHLLAGWWDQDVDLVPMLNENGSDLLTIALRHGHMDLFNDLLSRKEWQFNMNGDTERPYQSALREAIKRGDFGIVNLLLGKGVSPDGIIDGQSHLCLAVQKGRDYYTLSLENGADPNIRCDLVDALHSRYCGSALSTAAQNRDCDAMKALVRKGADVNIETSRDEWGSPLAAAAATKSLECVRFLVENGARVNSQLRYGVFGSPLIAALWGGTMEDELNCVRFLVEQGADVNMNPRFGIFGSPLAAAISSGKIGNARFLIEQGADVNAYLENGQYGSVLAAAILGPSFNLDVIKFLAEQRVDQLFVSGGRDPGVLVPLV